MISNFKKIKAISLTQQINDASIVINEKKFNKIKNKINRLLGEEIFGIENLLQKIVIKRTKLKIAINKNEDIHDILEKYTNNILKEYDCEIKFEGLFGYSKGNGIEDYRSIIIPKYIDAKTMERYFEYIIKNPDKNESSIAIPIYRLFKINNINNIKGYLLINIKKGSYKQIFFILNAIFWNIHGIMNDLLELKYQDVNKVNMLDPLTGIYLRKFFKDRLEKDILHKKENEKIYIMFCDIDHFKQFNDTFGHDVGDKVLKQFAKGFMENMRHKIDYIGRRGGEEFVVVFKFNGNMLSEKRIENIIKKKILKIKKDIQPKNIKGLDKITFSGGLFNIDEEKEKNNKENIDIKIEKFIKKADNRMYFAKQNGRNQIIFND